MPVMQEWWVFSLRLPAELREPLTGLANDQRRSVNRLIQVALEDYIAAQMAAESAA